MYIEVSDAYCYSSEEFANWDTSLLEAKVLCSMDLECRYFYQSELNKNYYKCTFESKVDFSSLLSKALFIKGIMD